MAGRKPDEYSPRRAYVPEPGPSDDSAPSQTSSESLFRPRTEDRPAEEETRLLPRTAAHDRDDDEPIAGSGSGTRPSRSKLALLVVAVAAVVALGLAAGYAVLGLGATPATAPPPSAPGSGAPSAAAPTNPEPTSEPAALLTDKLMLGAKGAEEIDADRTWKVALTQRGLAEDSPRPACLGGDQVEGQPSAQQTVLRLLSSSGKNAPGVLHQASAYGGVEEAAQAYAVTSKALGGCVMAGVSIESGARVRGLGDQALGMVVRVVEGPKTQFRTLVLSRTGRVLDVVDVASPTEPTAVKDLADAAATVVATQCSAAGGKCADKVSVSAGPPPLGGDHPGFLTASDLPVVGPDAAAWVGDQPGAPKSTFTGSQCESVDWAKEKADRRAHRTYVQAEGGTFGLDEIVLTLPDAAAARELVDDVRKDLRTCEDRLLTAEVAGLDGLEGTGAGDIEIGGWATTVRQQAASGTSRYRVAMVAAGDKAVFTFLNPEKDLDFTDDQWHAVAVRAGERATQVK